MGEVKVRQSTVDLDGRTQRSPFSTWKVWLIEGTRAAGKSGSEQQREEWAQRESPMGSPPDLKLFSRISSEC